MHTKPMGIQQKYFQVQILNKLVFSSLGILVVKFCCFWHFNLFHMHFPQKWFKYQSVYFLCKENSYCHNKGQTTHLQLILLRSYSLEKIIKFMVVAQCQNHVALALDSHSVLICHFTQSHPHSEYPGCISVASGTPIRAPI